MFENSLVQRFQKCFFFWLRHIHKQCEKGVILHFQNTHFEILARCLAGHLPFYQQNWCVNIMFYFNASLLVILNDRYSKFLQNEYYFELSETLISFLEAWVEVGLI